MILPAAISYAPRPEWQQFGTQHLCVLAITLILCLNLGVFRRELAGRRADVVLVVALVVVHLGWIALALAEGIAGPGDLLPLYTCDASVIAGIAWCRWKPPWLGQTLFCWATLGGVVTMLLPDTFDYALPHPAAAYTLLFHALLLLLGLEVWLVEGVRPSWYAIVPVALLTFALVPPALLANAAFGSDYMFVSRDPGGIFTFLTAYDGAGRVAMTLLSGTGVLLAGLAVWFVADRLLRAGQPMSRRRVVNRPTSPSTTTYARKTAMPAGLDHCSAEPPI